MGHLKLLIGNRCRQHKKYEILLNDLGVMIGEAGFYDDFFVQDPIFQKQPLQVHHKEELEKEQQIRQEQERKNNSHNKNKRKNVKSTGADVNELEEVTESKVPTQHNISLSRWVLLEACKLMEEYLKLGTELNVYHALEHESVSWYLSHIYFYHSSILTGIQSELQM